MKDIQIEAFTRTFMIPIILFVCEFFLFSNYSAALMKN